EVRSSEYCLLQGDSFEDFEEVFDEVGQQIRNDQSQQEAINKFKVWVSKYGSASAIEAAFKGKPKDLTATSRELMELVFKGERPRLIGVEPETGEHIPMSIEEYYPADERDLRMIRNIDQTIRGAGPNDLVIVFVGETHALDYFYRVSRGPESGFYYVGIPTRPKLRGLSQEMEEVLKLWKDLQNVIVAEGFDFDADEYLVRAEPDDFSTLSAIGAPTRLGAALYEENSSIPETEREAYLKDLRQQPDEFSKPKVIFLADHHEKRLMDHILEMPGAAEIEALGYNRIIFSFEGYNPDQEIESVGSLAQIEYWSSFIMAFQDLYSQIHQEFQGALGDRGVPEELRKMLKVYDDRIVKALRDIEEGRVVNHPAEHALLMKLREIEKASKGAISVKVVGNDLRTRGHPQYIFNELTPVEGTEGKPPVPWGWKNKKLNAE
ncbi:MAG: hypothetical protein ACO3LE_10330, partial [Bdellovibrionota bacterium]